MWMFGLRSSALSILLLMAFVALPAHAQININRLGPGGGHSGAGPIPPPAGYVGPADVVANPLLFYSMRAVSNAYALANGKLANLVRASDGHACDVLAATTGDTGLTANCGTGGDNGQLMVSFCGGTTCAVAIWYNQANPAGSLMYLVPVALGPL